MDDRGRAVAAASTAALLWGTVGTAQELGAPTASPVAVAAVRAAGGGLALLAVVLSIGRHRDAVELVRRSPARTLAAAVAITVFGLALLTSVREAGVAIGTLVSIGTAPVWAGLWATLSGIRPARRWFVATAATAVGVGLLVLPGGGVGDRVVVGILAGVVAGAAYGSYATVTARLVQGGAAGVPVVAVVFGISGLLLSPVLVIADLTWLTTRSGAAAASWLIAATTVLGYVCFARAVRTLDAPTVTTLTLAEPLAATALALLVVGERLTPLRAAGAGLLLVGLAVAGGRPGWRRPAGLRMGRAFRRRG